MSLHFDGIAAEILVVGFFLEIFGWIAEGVVTKLRFDESSPWTYLFAAQIFVILFFVLAVGWKIFAWPF
ncbi:MAG TPA: hypothetical protein VGP92_10475 [Acidimicrobiia bacterium]|jgi:hypothetical protein|nr:hypothetical protein [Acidimicrobiia bacterium]